MSGDLEQTAREIAEEGRDVLVERLRGAFEEAAVSHSEALTLDEPELDRMVQRAAEQADGLQWRRALAAVASEQLGIGLGEALSHPAVVRAHAILGAPSYEEGLARLGPVLAAPPTFGADEPEQESDQETDWPESESSIHVTGTHLGGIAALGTPEPGVELWFSDDGLDIIRPSQEPLGRLTWGELRALEVPAMRGRFGRRRRPNAYLVVRAEDGDASFEIPGLTPEELRLQLAAVIDRD